MWVSGQESIFESLSLHGGLKYGTTKKCDEHIRAGPLKTCRVSRSSSTQLLSSPPGRLTGSWEPGRLGILTPKLTAIQQPQQPGFPWSMAPEHPATWTTSGILALGQPARQTEREPVILEVLGGSWPYWEAQGFQAPGAAIFLLEFEFLFFREFWKILFSFQIGIAVLHPGL